MNTKTLYLVGGVNGAGKSSFISNSFGRSGINIVDVDQMAYEISGNYSYESNFAAGRKAVEILKNWPRTKKSLVWETILSNKYSSKVIQNFRKSGYHIDMSYIFLEDENTHIQRINHRVANGGHDIPSETVHRRFDKRSEHFFAAIRQADNWRMICNQNSWFELIAFGHRDEMIVSNQELFNIFNNPNLYHENKSIIKKIFGFWSCIKSNSI